MKPCGLRSLVNTPTSLRLSVLHDQDQEAMDSLSVELRRPQLLELFREPCRRSFA